MKRILTILALLLAGNLFAQEGMFIMVSPILPDRERAGNFFYAGKTLGFHFGLNAGKVKGREDGNTFNDSEIPVEERLQDEFLLIDSDANGVALGLNLRMSRYLTVFGGVDFIEYKVYEKLRDLDGDQVGNSEYFVYQRNLGFKKSYGYFGAHVQSGFLAIQAAYYPKTKEVLAGIGFSLDLIK